MSNQTLQTLIATDRHEIIQTIAVSGESVAVEYIRPPRAWVPIDFRELLRFRELLYFLVWRDFKVRYKQTVLGVAWALLQPVFSMIVFTVIFGKLAGLDSEGYPYAIYVYAGLLPWT
ncbi:MAG: ABC transporter permease, partial [Planctomycetota bacterium]